MDDSRHKSKSAMSLPNLAVSHVGSGVSAFDSFSLPVEQKGSSSTGDPSSTATSPHPIHLRGWLHKWTNYIKGYQRRWFVLNQGILSYYRSQAEMKYTCRGTMYMRNAAVRSLDACHFLISNGSTTLHLKAANEADKQKWISNLELAIAIRLDKHIDGGNADSVVDVNMASMDVSVNEKQLHHKLEELESCFDLIKKQQTAIQRSLRSTDGIRDPSKLKGSLVVLDERTTIFRITATNLINQCRSLLNAAKTQRQTVNKAYAEERQLRVRLEYVIEKMAKKQQIFEKKLMRSGKGAYQAIPGGHFDDTMPDASLKPADKHKLRRPIHKRDLSSSEDEEVFHDALDLELLRMPVGSIVSAMDRSKSPAVSGPGISDLESDVVAFKYDYESSDADEDDELSETELTLGEDGEPRTRRDSTTSIVIRMAHAKVDEPVPTRKHDLEAVAKGVTKLRRIRRTSIPNKPDYSLNLWSIIKNCIGKDLSRIPVPVNFSEPLSMLQRLTEELEYSELLDAASECQESCKQMAYVAAFTISVYSTTADRAAKPFNPLLGETYECDRTDDLGWRSIAEQVSHHPPALANYAEGKGWKLWQEFTMTSKFRGQYLSITPLGYCHLMFPETGDHYTWKKITTCVQNMIIGKLWIDNVGEMDIVNHKTHDRCHIKYYEYSMFSKDPPRKVTGIITDGDNVARWIINGKWNDFIEGATVKNPEVVTARSRFETHNPTILWRRRYPPPSLSRMYNFTTLAVQLNEEEDGVAPTDSRKRPDQRLMELGKWDEANEEKLRLEEKQRSARQEIAEENARRIARGESALQHKPAWFNCQHDECTNANLFTYTHEYWQCKEKQDWTRCPTIF